MPRKGGAFRRRLGYEGAGDFWNQALTQPHKIEAEPPPQSEPSQPIALPQRIAHRVEVDPEDIFPKAPARVRPFSFELIVSRYMLMSGVVVAVVALLLALSLAWLRWR